MNCRDFDRLLPELVGHDAGGDVHDVLPELTEAVRHCISCHRCARVLAVSRGELHLQDDREAEVAVHTILQRTTGDACVAAENRLPAWADGLLQAGDADLLAGHVAHCPSCRELAETLALLREELPAMAEADPGPDFAASVLALTSRTADSALCWPVRPHGPSLLDDIREASSAWSRYGAAVMRRPRAALELAYGASLIACLVLGSPATRVREVSSEMTALASRVPSPRLVMASVVPENGWEGAVGSLRGLAVKAEGHAPRGLMIRLVKAWKRTATTAAALRDHGPVLGQAIVRLDLVRAWKEAELIRQAGTKSGEPVGPAVRPGNDGGTATPGGAGIGPAASEGGSS